MASEWREVALSEVVALQRGHDLPESQRKSGNVPVMGSFGGITGYHNEAKVAGPGVTIGRSGASFGVVGYIAEDYWPLNTVLYVTDFKGNDPFFIFHLLKQINFAGFNSGSAQPSLNRNYISGVNVKLPSLPIQRQIAAILSAFDDKIELNRQVNRTLEAMARALFKSWFVDFDPVRAKMRGEQPEGMDAQTAALFPDGLVEIDRREVPSRWEWKTLDNLYTLHGGSTPSTANPDFWEGGALHWTSPKDLSGLDVPFLTQTEKKITEAGAKVISSGVLPPGTVLLSSRAPVGYLAISDMPISINQGYIALQPKATLGLYFTLNLLQVRLEEIKAMASGTTFPELSKKTFRTFEILTPNDAVSVVFEMTVSAFYEKIKSNVYESNRLTQLRDALLPRLLSGEVDVSRSI